MPLAEKLNLKAATQHRLAFTAESEVLKRPNLSNVRTSINSRLSASKKAGRNVAWSKRPELRRLYERKPGWNNIVSMRQETQNVQDI
jgi:hypothetical protein